MSRKKSVFDFSYRALMESDPVAKCRQAELLLQAWRKGDVMCGSGPVVESLPVPGRPALPFLVSPKALPKRNKLHTAAGRASLLHALAHIEFNAINLALDAVYRFRDLPDSYYGDWLKVASEEAYHFSLLRAHLQGLGFDYGAFPAHDGLWQMAMETEHDVLLRMALVPRVLEARGLDVTPALIERLRRAGDAAAAEILGVIRRDEIGHVAIGTRWFRFLCEIRALEPTQTFFDLVDHHLKGRLKGPFNMVDRAQAGFSSDELERLRTLG